MSRIKPFQCKISIKIIRDFCFLFFILSLSNCKCSLYHHRTSHFEAATFQGLKSHRHLVVTILDNTVRDYSQNS